MTQIRAFDAPCSAGTALGCLPPWLSRWFIQRYGEPSEVQRLAWQASGHLLVSAPTGSGKTLAALAPALGEMVTLSGPGQASPRALKALLVSPLKALATDLVRSLELDLADLEPYLPSGQELPRVAVRTGDTSAEARKQLWQDPPDLLATTPESLAQLLSTPGREELFSGLRWLIWDEAHALVGAKRGADLALSVERLNALAPDVRRIGLSATASPVEVVARLVAGEGRTVTILQAPPSPPPDVRVEPLPDGAGYLAALAHRVRDEASRNRSLLVFTNTRSLAERLGWALRRLAPELAGRVGLHHSAMSACRRRETECRLKRGELSVVVTSTSLELGIDVGSIGMVILAHPPGDVVRMLQRVGRAGHVPGGARRGLVLTSGAAELLEAVVTVASGVHGQCEPASLGDGPQDVLCQHLLGEACAGGFRPGHLFELCRRAAPYASLDRERFEECLEYLSGSRGWLPSRLREEGGAWHIRDERTARLVRRNLGTILTSPTVSVALARGEELTPIGELEATYAERLDAGDRFLLGGQCLELRRVEEGVAVVDEAPGRPAVPRWTGEGWPISPQLAQRLYLLRGLAAEALREGRLRRWLAEEYPTSAEGVEALACYFEHQEAVSEIPDASTLLVEAVDLGADVALYLHTPLNRKGNDGLARVAEARLGGKARPRAADLGLVLHVPAPVADVPGLVRRLFEVNGFSECLEESLDSCEAVRARFSQVAQTALMVLRSPAGRARKVGGPGWAARQLLDAIRARHPDFFLLRQARDEVKAQSCDGEAAEAYARSLPLLTIRCRSLSVPSPFAQAWTQMDEVQGGDRQSPEESLHRLLAELMGDGHALG
jgi:ATP-dependent Lhr-like helicase